MASSDSAASGILGPIEPTLHLVQIDARAFGDAQEDKIIPSSPVVVPQNYPAGKTSKKVAISLLTTSAAAFIERHPLGNQPTRVQMPPAEIKVLLGIERC